LSHAKRVLVLSKRDPFPTSAVIPKWEKERRFVICLQYGMIHVSFIGCFHVHTESCLSGWISRTFLGSSKNKRKWFFKTKQTY
jgi:hypothetical protein